MQDFIFNSNQRAHQRRRTFFVRVLLLTALAGIGYWIYLQFSANTPSESEQDEGRTNNQLPLPPIEQTQPIGKHQNPGAAAFAEKIASSPEHADQVFHASLKTNQLPDTSNNVITNEEATHSGSSTSTPAVEPPLKWIQYFIRKGDTLANIFKQQNLSSSTLHKICSIKDKGSQLSRIRPGQELRIGLDNQGRLAKLILIKDPVSSLHFQLDEQGQKYQATEVTRPVEKRVRSTSGIISSSLFVDGQKAGLDDSLIMSLANIFGWDIDFALEIKEGDQFHIVYEEEYLDGKKLKNGPILSAEFINNGKSHKAVRYTDLNGQTAYYDENGKAKQRAFLRTPVKFSRISSGFSRKRWHPVLKKWRSHKGVDYAAPHGTPVKATGNGKVAFKGKKGGYGNVIFLHHGSKYTTVYGHLSRFAKGLKTGSTVKQGQIIAYVGSTGLATGPHLHYEFRVQGKHQNPLTIKLTSSIRVPESEMARFKKATQPLLAQLNALKAKTMIASAH